MNSGCKGTQTVNCLQPWKADHDQQNAMGLFLPLHMQKTYNTNNSILYKSHMTYAHTKKNVILRAGAESG